MKKQQSFHKKKEKLTGNEKKGLVIAYFGARAEVLDEEGRIIHCYLRKNSDPIITGDQILWQPEHDQTGVIVSHLPRSSLLARPERQGKMKLLAANIDVIIIVAAPLPTFSEYLIDRYLVAAEHVDITPIILLNKIDTLDEHQLNEMQAQLTCYKQAGYTVLYSSAITKNGLDMLQNFLRDKTGVLVGVSGVGKSSIISALAPMQSIKTGEGVGKQTTTVTRFYHLPSGGNLIDSPGVREFRLEHLTPEEILQGFIEFKPFLNQCKFRNCQHLMEPDCALKKAVAEKKISEKRLNSFREMIKER